MISGRTEHTIQSSSFPIRFSEVVAFVQSTQFILSEPTPPSPSVSLLWLMSFPSCCPFSIKKEELPILLAFTPWLGCFYQTHMKTHSPDTAAPSPILVKSASVSSLSSSLLKVCLAFYSKIMTQTYVRGMFAYLRVLGNKLWLNNADIRPIVILK